MTTILIVDDELNILETVAAYLSAKTEFKILTAKDGTEALSCFKNHTVDFIVLDLMMPVMTGEEVCRQIRKTSDVPILMLTAKSQESSLLNGLELGADDYMVKPFSLKELLARIHAILRRTSIKHPKIWKNGELEADFESMVLKKSGVPVLLTPNEWKIFWALSQSPDRVFSREMLMDVALQDAGEALDRVIDSHIKNLRKKIENDPRTPHYILTVYGIGYKFGGEHR